MLKTVGFLGGRQILKLGFFWGIKYEPLSDPPSLKYLSGDPGTTQIRTFAALH